MSEQAKRGRCDGCSGEENETTACVVVLASGERMPSRYCEACRELAEAGWNPEIKTIEEDSR